MEGGGVVQNLSYKLRSSSLVIVTKHIIRGGNNEKAMGFD